MKKVACIIMEKYHMCLGNSLHTNKHMCEEIVIIPTKKLHNRLAGFVTHVIKHIQKDP